jgi:hypothetical protein
MADPLNGQTTADRIRHLDTDIRRARVKDARYLRPTAGSFVQQRIRDYKHRAQLVQELVHEQPNGKSPEQPDVVQEIYKDLCQVEHLTPPLSPSLARWRAAIISSLRADRDVFRGQLERLEADRPKTVYALPSYAQVGHHNKRHRELSTVLAGVQARLDKLDAPEADQKRARAVAAVLIDPGRVVETLAPLMQVPGAEKLRAARMHPGLTNPSSSYHRDVAARALEVAEQQYRDAQEREATRLVDLGLTGKAAEVLGLAEVIAQAGDIDLATELHALCGDDDAFIALIQDQYQNGAQK